MLAYRKRMSLHLFPMISRSVVHLFIFFGFGFLIWMGQSKPPDSNSQSPAFTSDIPFTALDNPANTFAVSAFMERNKSQVRIFLLKKLNASPRIYCSYSIKSKGRNHDPIVDFSPTFTPPDRDFTFHYLFAYSGEYRGFVVFCNMPLRFRHAAATESLFVILRTDNPPKSRPLAALLVQQALPMLQSERKFPHLVGLCITPWFNTMNYTPEFLVEYIEVHRVIGISLFVFYVAEELSPAARSTLDSYLTHPKLGNQNVVSFELVPWILPIENVSQNTWYREQVLSYNDCIYRFAHQAEYIFYADFDEVFVPSRRLRPNGSNSLPTWSDVIEKVRNYSVSSESTFCFPGKFFPPCTSNRNHYALNPHVFDRHLATVEAYTERRKCLVRSGFVDEMYIHHPISPTKMTVTPELGVILHYRECLRSGYISCDQRTLYTLNYDIDPYRELARKFIQLRLDLLK